MMKAFVRTTRIVVFFTVFMFVKLQASAYTDHRGVNIDSIEHVLKGKNPPQGEKLMRCYLDLIRGCLGQDTRKHEEYCHKALALTYRLDAKNARESVFYNLGLQNYGQEKWQEAERYFMQALAVTDSMVGDKRYKESDIDDNRSQLYGALGNLFNLQDKHLLAIEWYQKAMPIFEKNGWLESQTILHHNLGELYNTMGNNAKAIEEYEKAVRMGAKSGDSLMMALPLKGLVKIYLAEGNYEKTQQTLMPAYQYYHAHSKEETEDYPVILASMVRFYMMDGHENLAKAKMYATEALRLIDDEMMAENRCDVYAAATQLAMREGRWKEALEYGLKSVHENEDEATISDVGCFEMLAKIYVQLGDKEKAIHYLGKVRTMMERFANKNYQSGIGQMEIIYQTKEKEAQIVQLNKERHWILWGGGLAALVLLLTAITFFLLWRSIRLKRHTALVEAKLNGEITERVRIARDLHDRLGGTLTALKQNLGDAFGASQQTSSSDSGRVAMRLTDEAIREMRNVAHHLLPDSLQRYGLRTALRDYCNTMKNVDFSFTGEEQYIGGQHVETIYCLVYELVNNAVKNARANNIHVQLMADEVLTVVNVSDDGRGMPSEETDHGMGLRNIRERVEAIGGSLTCYSEPNKGTEINIEVRNNIKNPHLGD